MVKISKEQKDEILIFRLSGAIEEDLDFDKEFGLVSGEIHVYCKEVVRINSMGVKAWIRYFQALERQKKVIRFFECSPAIVQQANLISNFICGGSIESVYAPFACENCGAEFVSLFSTAKLLKLKLELPEQTCPKCNGSAVFDDMPKEYFAFMTRGSKG